MFVCIGLRPHLSATECVFPCFGIMESIRSHWKWVANLGGAFLVLCFSIGIYNIMYFMFSLDPWSCFLGEVGMTKIDVYTEWILMTHYARLNEGCEFTRCLESQPLYYAFLWPKRLDIFQEAVAEASTRIWCEWICVCVCDVVCKLQLA